MGGGADVFLVHGFGASSGHWRRTGPALEAAGHLPFAGEGYRFVAWA